MATSLMDRIDSLTGEQLAHWEANGYLIVRGFADAADCRALHERAVELARADASGGDIGKAKVSSEPSPHPDSKLPEELVGKIFWLHFWDPSVGAFITSRKLVTYLSQLIGPSVSCYDSQFIFKNRGAAGQPWHQDTWYHRLEPSGQVAAWLAITDATPENGPLWVVPGSHKDPIHNVEPDRRPEARGGYVEITGRDTSGEVVALLNAGDLLLFHSSIMHKSTDNTSDGPRVALVCHFSAPGVKEPPLDRPDELANTWVSSIKGDMSEAERAQLIDRYSTAIREFFRLQWTPVLQDGKPVPYQPA